MHSPMEIKNYSDTSVLQTQKGRAKEHDGNGFPQLKNKKENVSGDKHV